MPNNIRVWSHGEIQLLKAEYPQRGKVHCAEKLGRSVNAIRAKAHELGLKQDRSSAFFANWQSRAATNKGGNSWSEPHIRFLDQHFANFGAKAVAKSLGRTVNSVKLQASRLGLFHSDGVTFANRSRATREVALGQAQNLSDRMMMRMATGLVPYGHSRGKQGKREDLGQIHFRSSWEANYARYLNWLIAQGEICKWEYEPDTFWFHAIKRGVRTYKPDFKIWVETTSDPIYHELKGWLDAKSKTKLKRMTKYFPHVRVVLIDQQQYKAIAKAVSAIIPNWENQASTRTNDYFASSPRTLSQARSGTRLEPASTSGNV